MKIPGIETVYIGPHFERPYAAIVNSHQSRHPTREDSWVENTVCCVDILADQNAVLLGSIGLNCHELPLWHAGNAGLNQIVVTPIRRLENAGAVGEAIRLDFGLDPEQTGFLFFRSTETKKKSPTRDQIIIGLADRVFPVSVRENGRIRRLLESNPAIDRRFEVPFENRRPHRPIHPGTSVGKHPNWPYLTHWTRRFDGPFPGETRADYYRSVIETRSEYSHSALRSLIRILDHETIFSGSRGIRGGHSVVSLTRLPPEAAVRAMKWNAARVRYTFEPFGIAIRKTRLETLGARPVIYGDAGDFNGLDETDRPFFQNRGKDRKWTRESEWRVLGNLRLSDIPKTDILVLVPDESAVERVGRKHPDYQIRSLA